MAKLTIPKEEIMSPGHMGCQGCGATMAMRYALKALGKKTMISVPACCWAIIPGAWPNTCMQIPMQYTAFEVTGASISGIRAALDSQGMQDVNVVGWAGDGGTVDIGIQALSGMIERGHNVIYICYDNEAYMNTGIQRSGSTPYGAWTTTTPVGTTEYWEEGQKKNLMEIVVAHRLPYAATASVAYPEDFIKKLNKCLEIPGPKFFQVYAPCPTGWKSSPELSMDLARKAVTTRAFPIYEVEHGKYKINRKPEKTPLSEYLMLQGRFKHLPEKEVEFLDAHYEKEWKALLKLEEMTQDESLGNFM